MKPVLPFIVFWLLSCVGLGAQKALPVSLHPYVALNEQLMVRLKDAGFTSVDPGVTSTSRDEVQPRNQDLVLDSTINFISYPDSLPLVRFTYSYPDEFTEIAYESFFSEGAWDPITRTTRHKDHLGRDLEIVAEQYVEEGGFYRPDSRIEIFPRGNTPELVDSFFIYAWNTDLNSYVRQFSTWNAYNAEDQLIEQVSSIDIFKVPVFFQDVYTYDTEGNLLTISSNNLEGGEVYPAGLHEYTYDAGLLIAITISVSDGLGAFIPADRLEYTHNMENGWLESYRIRIWDFEKGSWMTTQEIEYDYDTEGRLIRQYIQGQDQSGSWQRNVWAYGYAKNDQRSFETLYYWDNDSADWVRQETTHYYYRDLLSASPNPPVSHEVLNVYPNPTTGTVNISLVEEENTVEVFNLDGVRVIQAYMPAGEHALDLSIQPAGQYLITVMHGAVRSTGRVILQ